MMSRHFALNSELTGAIAKRLPHAKNQPSAPGSFFNQFVTDIYIYIYIYSTRTKIFDHHRNRHTNSIKVGIFIKEYVLKL